MDVTSCSVGEALPPCQDPPRLMITKIVCENFKSYAGVKMLGPFHKVRMYMYVRDMGGASAGPGQLYWQGAADAACSCCDSRARLGAFRGPYLLTGIHLVAKRGKN